MKKPDHCPHNSLSMCSLCALRWNQNRVRELEDEVKRCREVSGRPMSEVLDKIIELQGRIDGALEAGCDCDRGSHGDEENYCECPIRAALVAP